jgi:site-specific recombinase XerD
MSIEQQKAKSERPVIRSLPIEEWPSAERITWNEACRPGVRLKGGGAASHLRPVTQQMLAAKNGLFLDFVARSKQLDTRASSGAHVTPALVVAFVEELKGRVSSVTVYGSIQKLRRFTQFVAPHHNVQWLIEIERELFSAMRPKSKWSRVVLAEIIIEAGLTLIAEAEAAKKRPRLTRARMVRDGLMIALLAHYPIRLKNYAALSIGRSLIKVDKVWWIKLTAAETKEKKPDERPIEEYLGDLVDKYIKTYRPILAREKDPGSALWLAMDGKPMAECYAREVITETTRATLGVPINPHMFRTVGATTAAIHAGHHPHLGTAILHHSRPHPENYNRASGISASKAYGRLTRQFRYVKSPRS